MSDTRENVSEWKKELGMRQLDISMHIRQREFSPTSSADWNSQSEQLCAPRQAGKEKICGDFLFSFFAAFLISTAKLTNPPGDVCTFLLYFRMPSENPQAALTYCKRA